ncbi:MAG: CcoQ/FixQ family Cbb3-type cytochrome c oxidase assembly chaperone [Bacteroidales bacterium]|nr:CcoQ/FixQ family Cbb3-type cytochrome c oxidase assembly chaperone [Bacteroidales bacterium]
MSKIVSRILENVGWLHDLSAILTLFFILIFIVIVIRVLKWKKEQVEEFKNMPLSDDDSDDL